MKQRKFVFAAITLLLLFIASGCAKKEETTTETASTSTEATASTDTSTSAMTSTSGTSATTGTATTSAVSDDDRKFMDKAAIGGMAEVQLANAVMPKLTNADVKSFADRMVTDHSKAGDELKALAASKNVTLAGDLDKEHKDDADKVMKAKNTDKAYISEMVRDHDKDVKEFEDASGKVKDADLKAWIDKTLPVLKEHQKMAHDTDKKVK